MVLTGVRSAWIIFACLLHLAALALYLHALDLYLQELCSRASPTDRLVTARTVRIALPNNHPSLSTRSNSEHAYSTTFAVIQAR